MKRYAPRPWPPHPSPSLWHLLALPPLKWGIKVDERPASATATWG